MTSQTITHAAVVLGLKLREAQILFLMILNVPQKTMPSILSLNDKNVSYHRANLYRKLGLNTKVQLTHLAIAQGIIPPITDWRPYTPEAITALIKP